MEKVHETFGTDVKVERNDPLRIPDYHKSISIAHQECNSHQEPILPTDQSKVLSTQTPSSCATPSSAIKVTSARKEQISKCEEVEVQPLIVRCLSQHPEELKKELEGWHVELSFSERHGKIFCSCTKQTKSGWRAACSESITSHVKGKYATVTDQKVPKDAAQELTGFLHALKAEAQLEFEFSKDGTTFSAAGRDEVIINLKTNTQSIFDKYTAVSVNIPYSREPENYHFLSQVKLPQLKDQLPPTVEIREDHSVLALKVHGMKKYIELFQQMLPEISTHTKVMVKLDPLVTYYFQSSEGQVQLESFKKQANCPMAIYFQSKKEEVCLTLLGNPTDRQSIEMVAERLAKTTGAVSRTVPQSFMKIQSQLDDYISLWQTLEKQHHVCIKQSANSITVAGLKGTVDCAMEELYKFIMEKCTIVYEIEMEKGELRLLSTHMSANWGKIVECCKSSGINLQIPSLNSEDVDSTSVFLKGEKDRVIEVFQKISTLKESIKKRSITVERAGTNYFVSENARMYLDGIENRTKVVIEVAEPIKDSMDTVSSASSIPSKFTRKCVAKPKQSSCQIGIYIGDITDFEKAEVIVNAANCELKHIGGVAAAIATKGGPQIQEESDSYVRRKGKLATGDAWLTTKVGNLPYKALVHAVGPIWQSGFNEEVLLEKACTEAMQITSHDYRSIVFPAISSGVYEFPIDKCAKCMTKSIIRYCESNPISDLEEICIVIHPSKAGDADHFISALQLQLPQESVIVDSAHPKTWMPSTPQYSNESPSSVNSGPSRSSRRKKSTKKNVSATADVLDCIKLTRGSLLDVKVCIILYFLPMISF